MYFFLQVDSGYVCEGDHKTIAKAIKDRVSLISRKREQRKLVRDEQEKGKWSRRMRMRMIPHSLDQILTPQLSPLVLLWPQSAWSLRNQKQTSTSNCSSLALLLQVSVAKLSFALISI